MRAIIFCALLGLVTGQGEDKSVLDSIRGVRSSFKAVASTDASTAACLDGMTCVAPTMCGLSGSTCEEGKVCCPREHLKIDLAQEDPADDGVAGRSSNGYSGNSFGLDPRKFNTRGPAESRPQGSGTSEQDSSATEANSGDREQFGQDSRGFDPRDNHGPPRRGPRPEVPESFRSGVDGRQGYTPYIGASYSASPRGSYGGGSYGVTQEAYGDDKHYGSFRHLYIEGFGRFAPDFYGPGFDLRQLSYPAREVLHKFRFKEECGVKRSNLFAALQVAPRHPYGGPLPYRPAPRGPPALSFRKLGEYPWQAALLGWTPRGYGLRCSATVVNPFLLITSAHCLNAMVEPELKVVLGAFDLLLPHPLLPIVERPVSRIFVHEDFNPATLAHDVALLQLPVGVNFQMTPHIGPACLPRQNQTFVATSCYIVGWTDPNPFDGPVPRTNEMSVSNWQFVASRQECLQLVSQYARPLSPNDLTEEMHCIRSVSESSCLGSSGGSLLCDVETIPGTPTVSGTPTTAGTTTPGDQTSVKHTFLAGIVSWSNGRCGKDAVAVITELSPYGGWINDLLSNAGGLDKFNPDYYGVFVSGYPRGRGDYGNSGYGAGYSNSGYGAGYGNSGYGTGYGNSGYGTGYGNSGYGAGGYSR